MEKLTEKDIEALDNIMNVEKSILDQYKKLIEHEIKKLPKEDIISEIIAIEVNEIVLLSQFEKYDKDLAILKYLQEKINDNTSPEKFEFYLGNNDETLCIKRLISYFKRYADLSNDSYLKTKANVVKKIYPKKSQLEYKSYKDAVMINDAIDKDNILILLNNISDEIKEDFANVKDCFIALKYHILFLYPTVETRYIERNFKDQTHDYLEAKLASEMIDVGLSIAYEVAACTKSLKLCKIAIDKLKGYTTYDFAEKEKKFKIIAYFAFIKTLTVTLNNEQIKELNNILNDIKTDENEIIIENIKYLLSKNSEEKNKHRSVSMIRTRN